MFDSLDIQAYAAMVKFRADVHVANVEARASSQACNARNCAIIQTLLAEDAAEVHKHEI